jgi:hypothetical protein
VNVFRGKALINPKSNRDRRTHEAFKKIDLAIGYALCPRCGKPAKALFMDGALAFVMYCALCKEILGRAGDIQGKEGSHVIDS